MNEELRAMREIVEQLVDPVLEALEEIEQARRTRFWMVLTISIMIAFSVVTNCAAIMTGYKLVAAIERIERTHGTVP